MLRIKNLISLLSDFLSLSLSLSLLPTTLPFSPVLSLLPSHLSLSLSLSLSLYFSRWVSDSATLIKLRIETENPRSPEYMPSNIRPIDRKKSSTCFRIVLQFKYLFNYITTVTTIIKIES